MAAFYAEAADALGAMDCSGRPDGLVAPADDLDSLLS
jgi:hypothetical protein